jgi:ATP-dependent Lhr-like helicase
MVTTPETLQAILPGRRMRENLSHLKAVVVDELHNLVESKRGVQLSVGLQRLRKVAPGFQLVALSATVGTPEVAADFLFGEGKRQIVKVDAPKEFTYAIEYPVPDPSNQSAARETYSAPDLAARLARMDALIESHTSTLIFVNSRTVRDAWGEAGEAEEGCGGAPRFAAKGGKGKGGAGVQTGAAEGPGLYEHPGIGD